MKSKFFPKKMLLLAVTILLGSYLYYLGPSEFSPRELHHSIYDLYLPDSPDVMTLWQRAKRYMYREITWRNVKESKEILEALNKLNAERKDFPLEVQEVFPEVIEKGFRKVPYRKREAFRKLLVQYADDKLRQYLFTLRQSWLYLVYSPPIINEFAGYEVQEKRINDVDYSPPPSKLTLDGEEVIHIDGDIDYLVIGSGPAGSVIAHELTRNIPDSKIVLVDSGSLVKPHAIDTEEDTDFYEMNNKRYTVNRSLALRNGMAVGGGSMVNSNLASSPDLPQIRETIQAWRKRGYINNKLLGDQEIDRAYAWVKSYVLTRKVLPEEINRNNQLLLEGDSRADTYHLNTKVNDPDDINKVSSLDAFIYPALHGGPNYKGQLSLISDVKVTKLLIDGTNRVYGVKVKRNKPLDRDYVIKDLNKLDKFHNTHLTIRAKNIIIASGTLGSAGILLNSGLKNDNIGKGLITHPSMAVVGFFDENIDMHKGLSVSTYAPGKNNRYFFEPMYADPRAIAIAYPGNGHNILNAVQQYRKIRGIGILLVDEVSPSNKVFIDDGSLEVFYHLSHQDKKTMQSAMKKAVDMLFKQGAKAVMIPTGEHITSEEGAMLYTKKAAYRVIDKIRFKDGLNYISSAHMQSSNKMGNHPSDAVVSHNFRFWDQTTDKEIPNLYICDSSVFPTSVGANPMQSIYTVAKIFSDKIVQEYHHPL